MSQTPQALRRRFREVAAQVGRPLAATASEPAWMTTQDLAEHLRLLDRTRPRDRALQWARRHRLTSVIRNREHLFARRDVERALQTTRTTVAASAA